MSEDFLKKYVGKYRVVSEIDMKKNDFPRDKDGKLESNDLYIKCRKGNKIYYYGGRVLVGYIPSVARGRHTVARLKEAGVEVFDEEVTDAEVLFKFHSKYIETVAQMLDAFTVGANVSPFSSRNLKKNEYKIPEEDLAEYKAIIAKVPKLEMLKIKSITQTFLNITFSRDVSGEMRMLGMKSKEFIHYKGEWKSYLKYLGEKL